MDRRDFFKASIGAAITTPLWGGAAQALSPELKPQYVSADAPFGVGEIIVVPSDHFLYLMTGTNEALRYGVGVGRAGSTFRGYATVSRKAKWPSWRPTNSMIKRNPGKYARFKNGVPGGPGNPLGSRALYLYQDGVDTYYRIHGTTDPSSIGRSVSNGCIRMINAHVNDLYDRVAVGAQVTVL